MGQTLSRILERKRANIKCEVNDAKNFYNHKCMTISESDA